MVCKVEARRVEVGKRASVKRKRIELDGAYRIVRQPTPLTGLSGYTMTTENFATLAASRMKSATSVESDHCEIFPDGDVLWNSTLGDALRDSTRAGAVRVSSLAIRRQTCESGWEGCRRKTTGGASRVLAMFVRGRTSLKRCEAVGRSLPDVGC